MYSITTADLEKTGQNIFLKQSIFSLLGIASLFFFALTDYHYLKSYGRKIYFVTLLVLLAVLVLGNTIRGTSGWLGIGFINFQPVEIAKIVLIIFLASFFSQKKNELGEFVRLTVSFILATIIIFLVLKQPDLGSALILFSIWIGMVLVSGISKKAFLALFLMVSILITSSWFFLADYQKNRIMTMLNPEKDPRGSGYNLIQSIVAVGSGGMRGKGIGHGTQSQLNFLPEKHTDFIFAVITEELGILGAFFILALYLVFLYRMKIVASSAADNFGYLMVSGIMVMLFSQIAVNIGMNIGILPVTGITLPLLSYGGSSLLAVMISVGIVLNIGEKRNTIDGKFISSY